MSIQVTPAGKSAAVENSERATRLTLVRPVVRPAKLRRRHYGVWFSFLLLVIAPVAGAGWYLYERATDQYASTVSFSVRTEEISSPVELFGGLAQLSGSSTSDTDILYEYVRSQELVEILEERLSLGTLYAVNPDDPVFTFDPSGTIEDLHAFWLRMARIDYDPGTGLIELRVLAFTPEDAQRIAQTVFEESARVINEITSIARADNISFTRTELDDAEERLKTARQELTEFRSRSKIADPEADVQGQMGLLSSLEQTLAETLIANDILHENTQPDDPRIALMEQKIAIIERRIEHERNKFSGAAGTDANFSSLIGEYERLTVEQEIAEEAYALALAAYHSASAEARRKSRYLAAHIKPTLAQTSEFPRRPTLLAVLGIGLLLTWAFGVLVYYSVRDRR